MNELEMRIAVFKSMGWTDLAVRPKAPHHWPDHPLDEAGNALTGKPPGFNGFREPDLLTLDVIYKAAKLAGVKHHGSALEQAEDYLRAINLWHDN